MLYVAGNFDAPFSHVMGYNGNWFDIGGADDAVTGLVFKGSLRFFLLFCILFI
jgi:hypothetical protein